MNFESQISEPHRPGQSHPVSRITKNSFFLLFAEAVNLIFGLLSIAIFARYLGISTYGQYAFINSIVLVFLTLPHFGMRRVVMREVTQNKEKANQYLGWVIILRAVLSIIAIIAVTIALVFLDLAGIYVAACYIILISEITATFSMGFMTIFFAFERMAYNTLLTMITRTFA